jgi:hypothetical protein
MEVPHGRLLDDRTGDVDVVAGALAWKDPSAIKALITKHRESHPSAPAYLHAYCAAVELASQGGLLGSDRNAEQ